MDDAHKMDYASNKNKDRSGEPKPPKNLEKVVVGEVIVQKKSIGRKFKDTFLDVDSIVTISTYAWTKWFLPAGKSLLWDILDAFSDGAKNKLFGGGYRRGYGPGNSRISYNNPISRSASQLPRGGPTMTSLLEPRRGTLRREECVLSLREDAEMILERMNDIIDKYDVVSVLDLNELLGLPIGPVDNKYGWVFLGDVPIRQVRDGYLIDFPQAEPIS